jgi:hypothetical protein
MITDKGVDVLKPPAVVVNFNENNFILKDKLSLRNKVVCPGISVSII